MLTQELKENSQVIGPTWYFSYKFLAGCLGVLPRTSCKRCQMASFSMETWSSKKLICWSGFAPTKTIPPNVSAFLHSFKPNRLRFSQINWRFMPMFPWIPLQKFAAFICFKMGAFFQAFLKEKIHVGSPIHAKKNRPSPKIAPSAVLLFNQIGVVATFGCNSV